jgi:hypothetical protein
MWIVDNYVIWLKKVRYIMIYTHTLPSSSFLALKLLMPTCDIQAIF